MKREEREKENVLRERRMEKMREGKEEKRKRRGASVERKVRICVRECVRTERNRSEARDNLGISE